MTYTIIATINLKPGCKDKWFQEFQEVLKYVQTKETNTLVYEAFHDPADENKIVFFEKYADEDAFKAHAGSDVFQAFVGRVKDYMLDPPINIRPLTETGYRK